VRVAVDLAAHQRQVVANLTLGVEAAAGVVEVDVPLRVQARVLAGAQTVEFLRGRKLGVRVEKGVVHNDSGGSAGAGSRHRGGQW